MTSPEKPLGSKSRTRGSGRRLCTAPGHSCLQVAKIKTFGAPWRKATREWVPLRWALAQNNLDSALQMLEVGERDGAVRRQSQLLRVAQLFAFPVYGGGDVPAQSPSTLPRVDFSGRLPAVKRICHSELAPRRIDRRLTDARSSLRAMFYAP